MAKTNKKLKKTPISKKAKVLLISIMSVVVALSVVATVVFGFKMHLYGTKYTVTLNANGGKVTPITMQVEFGKEYSLPKATKEGEVFAYWRIGGEQTKVKLKGVWTIDKDVTLVAVWQSEVKDYDNDDDWTGNY